MSLQPENICQMLRPGRQAFKYMSTVIVVNLKSKVLEIQGLKRLSSGNSIDRERMVSKADTYCVLLAIEKLASNTDSDVCFSQVSFLGCLAMVLRNSVGQTVKDFRAREQFRAKIKNRKNLYPLREKRMPVLHKRRPKRIKQRGFLHQGRSNLKKMKGVPGESAANKLVGIMNLEHQGLQG